MPGVRLISVSSVRATAASDSTPVAPGTTAKVVFPIHSGIKDGIHGGDAALRVPERAIVRRGELTGVYVLKDGTLTLRQLRPGTREGDSVEVLAGLRAGDVVALDPEAALQALIEQRVAQRDAGGAGHE